MSNDRQNNDVRAILIKAIFTSNFKHSKNLPENQNTYCQAALFRCNCCNYEAEIYFNEEFLKESEESLCDNCRKEGHYKFDSILINRDDLDGIVLHPQFASLPDDKNKCSSCSGIEKISWKEVVVKCIECGKDAMYFVGDAEGKNIKLYKEWCNRLGKTSASGYDVYG